MATISRRGLSEKQRRLLWARWRAGESLSEIGRLLSKPPGSVFGVLRANGGIAPAERKRSTSQLGLEEREEISRGLAAAHSYRAIADRLRRSPSTISREVRRNGGREGYRAALADADAWQRAGRPKRCRLASRPRLRRAVARRLQQQWSPQQISGWLQATYRDVPAMQISHETIYKSLFIQARGVLKKELLAHLRSRRVMRRARSSATSGQGRGQIKDAVSIRERPAEADDRAIPGHWEGDLICGSNNSYIATLVERQTRFVMLVRVRDKSTDSVVDALARRIGTLPACLKASLTWDRGLEMADHKRLSIEADIAIYFCDPKSPWQRGSNENTNGLLRQYFPKGTDLSVHSQATLDAVARRLNTRPRQTLGFVTPGAMLAARVALTG